MNISRAWRCIGRAEAEQRMLAKFARPDLLGDVLPLLPPRPSDELAETVGRLAFVRVFEGFIERLPGSRWARTEEVALQLGLTELTGGR